MITKDLLIIGGENKISIIDVNQYKLVRIVEVKNSSWIRGFCFWNDNIFLTSDNNRVIREWKIEGNNLILISQKENAHDRYIFALLKLGNWNIASASADNSIIIW